MNAERFDQEIVESLFKIYENDMLFLRRNFNTKEISQICGVDATLLENALLRVCGLSVDNLTAMYRVQYAADLYQRGVEFKRLHKYCGFSNRSSFMQAL